MSLNDPLAQALSHLLNCEKKGRKTCQLTPSSTTIKRILTVMQDHHYLGSYDQTSTEQGGTLTLHLLGGINNCGVIKPRFSITKKNYELFEKRYLPAKGFGILIITTSKGIMTHHQALSQGFGGKLLAYCY
ncbi:MAG TPA: 30S ribosomal protein S8 [Candidatus Nanoarchaeia archaeon]|nr:30S ribosomal protein S8 [Candidatus Nanoarchaeia archaeon]